MQISAPKLNIGAPELSDTFLVLVFVCGCGCVHECICMINQATNGGVHQGAHHLYGDMC